MKYRFGIIAGVVLLGALIAAAYLRSGLLNLPSVPEAVTPNDAGLQGLDLMKRMDEAIASGGATDGRDDAPSLAALAVAEIRKGEHEKGLHRLQEAVRADPTHLVLGNRLRMEVLQLKRAWLRKRADQGEIALDFPDDLRDEPVRFFRELVNLHPAREARLQLALALVDQMVLFPALEIKAPASVEAVEILTGILQDRAANSAYYVPALYARGLNFLYRPFNLVWPERLAAPADAASKDIALAVAVGQQIGVGSDALKAELALSLGDAYAKEGNPSLARSWWQLAKNMARNDTLRERVLLRLKWDDDDVRANLEETLQRQMEDIDHPVSDLRFMWQ